MKPKNSISEVADLCQGGAKLLQQTRSTSPRILYIDDDEANRTLVNRLLSSYDFEVIEAANGLEGIKLAKENPPHLILMDINMPGLDGHETTTRMRSLSILERVPIVAVTAHTAQGERELALAAGCDGYIPKPIDVDEFPLQVINYLDGRKDTLTADEHQRYLGQYSHKLVERLETKLLELQEANTRLQKIDKLKSDFITLAAHELRTPISLVYGYARLLQLSVRGNEPGNPAEGSPADLANRVFHAVHRLNEVVNDILNIALIQANQIYIEQQPVHLAQVIQTALNDLAPAENERALTITLQNLESLPPIMGDFQRLYQAFNNLLSNAIKYTPDGRSILITGWTTSSSVLVKLLPKPHPPLNVEGVIILIKDTGIGLDQADQKEIFEQFYVVEDIAYHTSSKTAFGGGGMGLGLPITRGIIEAHQGQVWVESAGRDNEANPGCTFYVFLPLTPSAR